MNSRSPSSSHSSPVLVLLLHLLLLLIPLLLLLRLVYGRPQEDHDRRHQEAIVQPCQLGCHDLTAARCPCFLWSSMSTSGEAHKQACKLCSLSDVCEYFSLRHFLSLFFYFVALLSFQNVIPSFQSWGIRMDNINLEPRHTSHRPHHHSNSSLSKLVMSHVELPRRTSTNSRVTYAITRLDIKKHIDTMQYTGYSTFNLPSFPQRGPSVGHWPRSMPRNAKKVYRPFHWMVLVTKTLGNVQVRNLFFRETV